MIAAYVASMLPGLPMSGPVIFTLGLLLLMVALLLAAITLMVLSSGRHRL